MRAYDQFHLKYAKNLNLESNMPQYFEHVFQHVIKKIDHGDVCDLGSHAIGHFWAMGYVERVNSYSCYDLNSTAINFFTDTIKNWNAGDLEKNFPHHLKYLYQTGIISAPVEEIEQQIVNKLAVAKVFDFLNDKPDRKYDIVMANESLPVVHSYEDFQTAMSTAYNFLKPGGLLLTVSGPFEQETTDVKERQTFRIEGSLSPDETVFKKAMMSVGFQDIQTAQYPVANYENYKRIYICQARRPG